MSIQKSINEVLEHLFEGYQSNPTAIFDITEVIKEQNPTQDPNEFGTLLLNHGYIKNQQYRPTGFVCQISINGIEKIAPSYLNDKIEKVVSTLGISGGQGSIMEILEFEDKNFQAAFDIVKYMENRGFIKQGIYHHNDIIIELSLSGKEYFDKNKASFN